MPGKATLYTDDVTPEFMYQWSGWIPDPAQPLWEIIWASLNIPAGTTSATFEIPTVADGIVEGREYVTVTLSGWEDPLLPSRSRSPASCATPEGLCFRPPARRQAGRSLFRTASKAATTARRASAWSTSGGG